MHCQTVSIPPFERLRLIRAISLKQCRISCSALGAPEMIKTKPIQQLHTANHSEIKFLINLLVTITP